MKINILTGLYQKKNCSTSGAFIYNRLKILHQKNIQFEVWMIETYYPSYVKQIYKWLKRHQNGEERVIEWELTEKQHIVPVKMTLYNIICSQYFPFWYHRGILKLIKKSGCFNDNCLFHAHWTFPDGYCATQLGKIFNKPSIVTAHGSDIHTTPINSKKNRRWTIKTLNAANKVIFISHALLDSAISLGYSGDNAVVISNGVDSQYFFPMKKEEALIRTGWKQTHKYVVGFVGHLYFVKRADKLAEIFSQIHQRINDVEFIVIGTGNLQDSIYSECVKYGLQVTFTGMIPHEEVGCWMNLFDVMILPSRNEGFGCVVLESYACGIPVVGSANGGIPEALGGFCPAILDGDDFERRFAEAVCDVLMGKTVVDSEKLVSWALEHTWEKCVEKEIELYRQLLNNH